MRRAWRLALCRACLLLLHVVVQPRPAHAGHPESVTALLRYDDDSVLSGSSDGLIRVLSLQPNRMLGVLGEHSGAPLAVCVQERSGVRVQERSGERSVQRGLRAAWPSVSRACTAGDARPATRAPRTLARRAPPHAPTAPADYPIERLAMSADRAWLASASHDNTVKLWDLSCLAEDDDDDEAEEGKEDAEDAEEGQQAAAGAAGAAQPAAAAAGGAGGAAAAAGGGGSDSDNSDDSDSDGGRRKGRKRGKGQHRIPSKKQAKTSNFFSDLL